MKKYLLILAVAMTAMACSNDDENPQAPNGVEPTTEEQDSVGGEPFGYAPSFVLSETIKLSEQNCAVVRSKEEMTGIELTTKELPNVDFTKDNLVVGVIRIPNSGFGVTKVDLKEEAESYKLDVYIKEYDGGFDMAGWLCYWNVFPKLADKPIDVNILNVDGSKFPWAQDKYQDSVGGEPFGYAPSFVLSKSIELSEQNCAVVRSKEEMAGIELTTKELPNVDFTKEDLVVGVIRIPNSGFGVTKVDLKEQDGAYKLDVYIKKYDSGFDMVGWLCYWNVFPKLADKPIDVNLLNVDGSKFPWPQDKYVDETVSD